MALEHAGDPVPEVREGAHCDGQKARASTDRVCLWPGPAHVPVQLTRTLQRPTKPTSTRTTSTLGSQILVTVTLGGAVPYRPQAGLLPGILKNWGPGAIYTDRPCYLEFTAAQHY